MKSLLCKVFGRNYWNLNSPIEFGYNSQFYQFYKWYYYVNARFYHSVGQVIVSFSAKLSHMLINNKIYVECVSNWHCQSPNKSNSLYNNIICQHEILSEEFENYNTNTKTILKTTLERLNERKICLHVLHHRVILIIWRLFSLYAKYIVSVM